MQQDFENNEQSHAQLYEEGCEAIKDMVRLLKENYILSAKDSELEDGFMSLCESINGFVDLMRGLFYINSGISKEALEMMGIPESMEKRIVDLLCI